MHSQRPFFPLVESYGRPRADFTTGQGERRILEIHVGGVFGGFFSTSELIDQVLLAEQEARIKAAAQGQKL